MTRFELAWAGYQNHAEDTGNPDAEERLYAALANLALVVGSVSSVKQPSSLASSLDELMAAAETYNSTMHGVVRGIVEGMNGVYQEGPLKMKERVEEKVRGWTTMGHLTVVPLPAHHTPATNRPTRTTRASSSRSWTSSGRARCSTASMI